MDYQKTILDSFNDDTMLKEYFRDSHNQLLKASLSNLYKYIQKISYPDLMKHIRIFENSIESDIYDMFYEEEKLVQNNIKTYKAGGSTTTERIGSAMEWSIESSIFLKYLVCLSYAYAHYSFKTETKKKLLCLLSSLYYESRRRLLLFKDVMPEDTSIVLVGFIRDNCKGIKSGYSRKKTIEIKKSFDESFKVCRDYRVPCITVMNNSSDDVNDLRVTIQLSEDDKTKIRMRSRTALVFLALFHNYCTKSSKKFSAVTYEKLCEGYGIKIHGDKIDKSASDTISHINTRHLHGINHLLSIEGHKDNWYLDIRNCKLRIIYQDFFLHKKFAGLLYFKNPEK